MKSRLFRVGMYWRILYGVLRTLLGLALLKLVNMPLAELLYALMSQELIEESSNFLFTATNSFLLEHHLSVTYFMAGYLIFWGLVDIVLSVFLLRHKMWAFPVSLLLIGVFILYEVYRFTYTHSLILLSVICIDLSIYWLIRKEFKNTKLVVVS